MRFHSVVLLGMAALLAGCASRSATVTFGSYEVLQPRLVSAPSGTRLHLARPAYVQILRTSSHGVELLYPDRGAEPAFFGAGAHTLDVPLLRQPPAGGCTTHESSVSAFGDEKGTRIGGITRTFTRRGQRLACHRPGTRIESGAAPVLHLLVLASESPLSRDRINEVAASLKPPAGAEPAEIAAAFTTRLIEADGDRVWAGSVVSVLRIR
jgi:hypothetical protein